MASSSGGTHPPAFGTIVVALLVVACLAVGYHLTQADEVHRGRKPKPHAIYVGSAALLMGLVPLSVARYIFSALAVVLVATIFPIYESIRAVCTPEEDDDKKWLQYWMVGGVLFMLTQWVDGSMVQDDDDEGELTPGMMYWHEACFFIYIWLYFPSTSGSALIYDYVTAPYISPKIRPLQNSMNSVVAAVTQAATNAVHLWFVWLIFMFLPAGLKRIIAVLLGTIYPLVSSITASTTEDISDDTYWLTYWACYGCLFLIMQFLETWLGWLPGFYTLIIFATIYLMLPMFQGADKIFRKVLVPLAGLQEMLMLKDAILVKKAMLRSLDPERATAVRKAIAKFYAADDGQAAADPVALKSELLTTWKGMHGITLPAIPRFHIPNFPTFGTSSDDQGGAVTENTNLVV